MVIVSSSATTDQKILTLLAHAALGRRLLPIVWIMDDGRCSCMTRENANDTRICSRAKPGKHPRISQWQIRASCDPDQLVQWHQWVPRANWAWVQDQTFTLDVDPKRGGLESLAQWEEEAGGPEPTLTQRTQSGGFHFIYRQPAEPIRVQGDMLPGIEIRGLGSYIVIDPSMGLEGCWQFVDVECEVAEADELTLRLIAKNGLSLDGSGGSGKSSGKCERGEKSTLPSTLWFMQNGFGEYTGSRNVDAYRLSWRLLMLMDQEPTVYTREYVAGIMKQCWLQTEQGSAPFDWSECLGAMNSAWVRRERQRHEKEAQQRMFAVSLRDSVR